MKKITWDTGEWRNCFHFNPIGHEAKSVHKMSDYAIKTRVYDVLWGVVNRGNGLCLIVYRTKKEAEEYRRESASAYVVVRVVVTPLYTQADV